MKDRFGQSILIGWADHEIEWVEAANTLCREQRKLAYRDIAELTGRTVEAVRRYASHLRWRDVRQVRAIRKRLPAPPQKPIAYPPSQIAPPSKSRLMGCR